MMTQLPAQRATTQTVRSSKCFLRAQQHFSQACQSMAEAQVCFLQHLLCTVPSANLCPFCTIKHFLAMSAPTAFMTLQPSTWIEL